MLTLLKDVLFHCPAANNKAYLLFNGDLVRLDNITNKNLCLSYIKMRCSIAHWQTTKLTYFLLVILSNIVSLKMCCYFNAIDVIFTTKNVLSEKCIFKTTERFKTRKKY